MSIEHSSTRSNSPICAYAWSITWHTNVHVKIHVFTYLPLPGWWHVREGLVQEGDVRHDSLVIRFGHAHILRVNDPHNAQLLFRHSERLLQVLNGLVWITIVVVQQIWPMAVQNGTECQPITPATGEVGDFDFVISAHTHGSCIKGFGTSMHTCWYNMFHFVKVYTV